MGDRTAVTLTIRTSQVAKARPCFDTEPEYEHQDEKGFTEFTFYEVNYGNLEFLDQLQETGIAYDSRWESGSEFGSGCDYCRFTHDGEVILKGISDDYRNPSIDELMKNIDDYAALKAFITKHYNEIFVPSWDSQEEYGKIYRTKQLIAPT